MDIVSNIMSIINAILFIAIFIGVPIYLTIMNVMNLFRAKKFKERSIDVATIIVGGIYSMIYYSIFNTTNSDWNEAVYSFQTHALLNTNYRYTVYIVMTVFLIGLIVLCLFEPKRLSPLVSAISIATIPLGVITILLLLIQLCENLNIIPFVVYYFNLILIAIRVTKFHITEHVRINNEHKKIFRNKLAYFLNGIMLKVSTMTTFSFMLVFPIVIILEVIFILCGQGVDGFIKAFTITADWTFSTQTPPPPIDYSGHYLCTVAVQGHEKIVKPIRYGKRLGKRIVVNRQLLIANAFEDLIKEKLPHFHKVIRHVYDTYGYPISKYITTKFRADVIYILMKPLEYIFLLVLYLFDTNPENRIAVQYSDYKKEVFKCQ